LWPACILCVGEVHSSMMVSAVGNERLMAPSSSPTARVRRRSLVDDIVLPSRHVAKRKNEAAVGK
jgi:hypothetical protein